MWQLDDLSLSLLFVSLTDPGKIKSLYEKGENYLVDQDGKSTDHLLRLCFED
jgi:hypothetical protein